VPWPQPCAPSPGPSAGRRASPSVLPYARSDARRAARFALRPGRPAQPAGFPTPGRPPVRAWRAPATLPWPIATALASAPAAGQRRRFWRRAAPLRAWPRSSASRRSCRRDAGSCRRLPEGDAFFAAPRFAVLRLTLADFFRFLASAITISFALHQIGRRFQPPDRRRRGGTGGWCRRGLLGRWFPRCALLGSAHGRLLGRRLARLCGALLGSATSGSSLPGSATPGSSLPGALLCSGSAALGGGTAGLLSGRLRRALPGFGLTSAPLCLPRGCHLLLLFAPRRFVITHPVVTCIRKQSIAKLNSPPRAIAMS
jgi:hypothetical protein